MKALVGAFNQEKALVGQWEPMDRFAALIMIVGHRWSADTAQITSSRHHSRYSYIYTSTYLLPLQAPAPPPAAAATAASCATPAAAAASSLTDINIFLLGNIFLLSQHKYFRSGTETTSRHWYWLSQQADTTSQSKLQTIHTTQWII